MMDDHDLHARFSALRHETDSRAPSFAAVRARAIQPRPPRLGALTLATSVVIVIGAVVLSWRSPDSSPPPMTNPSASVLSWKSPTGFLLHTSDQPWFRTIPKLGEVPSSILTLQSDPTPLTLRTDYQPENFS